GEERVFEVIDDSQAQCQIEGAQRGHHIVERELADIEGASTQLPHQAGLFQMPRNDVNAQSVRASTRQCESEEAGVAADVQDPTAPKVSRQPGTEQVPQPLRVIGGLAVDSDVAVDSHARPVINGVKPRAKLVDPSLGHRIGRPTWVAGDAHLLFTEWPHYT